MKLVKFLLACSLALVAITISVDAETVTGTATTMPSTTHDVTGTIVTESSQTNRVTDVIAFEVVWEDTQLEITKTEEYGIVWDPDTLMYVKDESISKTTYALTDDEMSVSVKNLSVSKIQVSAIFVNNPYLFNTGSVEADIDGVTLSNGNTLGSTGTPAPAVKLSPKCTIVPEVADPTAVEKLAQKIENGEKIGEVTVEVKQVYAQ